MSSDLSISSSIPSALGSHNYPSVRHVENCLLHIIKTRRCFHIPCRFSSSRRVYFPSFMMRYWPHSRSPTPGSFLHTLPTCVITQHYTSYCNGTNHHRFASLWTSLSSRSISIVYPATKFSVCVSTPHVTLRSTPHRLRSTSSAAILRFPFRGRISVSSSLIFNATYGGPPDPCFPKQRARGHTTHLTNTCEVSWCDHRDTTRLINRSWSIIRLLFESINLSGSAWHQHLYRAGFVI